MSIMFRAIDKILRLLKYEFLDIFWFYFWIFWMGEMIFFSIEKIMKLPTVTMWYDLVWLFIIYIFVFLTSFRLYIVMIKSSQSNKND